MTSVASAEFQAKANLAKGVPCPDVVPLARTSPYMNPCVLAHSGFLILVSKHAAGNVIVVASCIKDPAATYSGSLVETEQMSFKRLLKAGGERSGRKMKIRYVDGTMYCLTGPYEDHRFTSLDLVLPLQLVPEAEAALLRQQMEVEKQMKEKRSKVERELMARMAAVLGK